MPWGVVETIATIHDITTPYARKGIHQDGVTALKTTDKGLLREALHGLGEMSWEQSLTLDTYLQPLFWRIARPQNGWEIRYTAEGIEGTTPLPPKDLATWSANKEMRLEKLHFFRLPRNPYFALGRTHLGEVLFFEHGYGHLEGRPQMELWKQLRAFEGSATEPVALVTAVANFVKMPYGDIATVPR